MAVSSCPSCREPVMVPAGAPSSARVRCPLCRDEFLLSVVLDKLPPTLELLDAPVGEGMAAPAGGISIGPIAGTRAPAFEFDEAAAPTASRKVSPSARPKKKEKSMVFELVKIVLGGVAGIVLATVILWWGFHKDPLSLAPKVAAYASWAVPEKLRPPVKESPPEKSNESKGTTGASSLNRNGGMNLATTDPGATKPGATKKPPPQGELLGDPFGNTGSKKPDDDPLKLDPLPGIGTTAKEPKKNPTKSKEIDPQPTGESEKPKPKRFDLAKTIKKRSALDLARAVTDLQQATDDIDAALTPAVADLSTEKKREFSETYHNAIARLGEVIISVDPNDLQIQNEQKKLAPILQGIAESSGKQNVLGLLGERWLANTGRPHTGLCVVGVVKNIAPSGKLYEIDVELLTKNKTIVKVFTGDNPAAFYQPEDRVMLLGAIVPDPKKNLAGYEGEATEANCVHFYVPLKEPPPVPETTPAVEKPAASDKAGEKPAGRPEPNKPSDEESK